MEEPCRPNLFERRPKSSRSSQDEPATLERRLSWPRGRMLPVDCTQVTRRRSSERRRSLVRTPESRKWWKFTLRPWDDDQARNWWFASTAIPLLAATMGPLGNVLSIAAIVTSWRMCLVDGVEPAICTWDGTSVLLLDLDGHTYADPHWCYVLNIVSLVMGFVGNLFLLFNFTNRIRYIIALPLTIGLWYAATGIVGQFLTSNVLTPD